MIFWLSMAGVKALFSEKNPQITYLEVSKLLSGSMNAQDFCCPAEGLKVDLNVILCKLNDIIST